MLLAMLKIEHTKLYRRKALWIELAVIAGLIALLFGLILALQTVNEIPESEKAVIAETLLWPNGILVALSTASHQILGGLLIIVLVSMAVAQEYTWQTYSLALRAGVSRRTALVSKFVTLAGAAFLMVMVALAAGLIMSGWLTGVMSGPAGLSRIDPFEIAISALTTAYALLPYMALTFLIAVVTRSLPASIGITFGYVFLVEGILPALLTLFGGIGAQLAMLMPGQLASALSSANGQMAALQAASDGSGSASQFADPAIAVIGIAAYTVMFLVLAILKFGRQDLTA